MPRVIFLILLAFCLPLIAATPAAEFGPSIDYAKGTPSFSLGQMRGKMVLVLFFQSWCPICNGWSPDLIQQIEKAYANDHRVVLVGIKTDGDAASGPEYLKTHGGNPDAWLIAGDADASYVQTLIGRDKLWQYAIIDPTGNLAEDGSAGVFHPGSDGRKYFLLVDPDVVTKNGANAKPLLTGTYSDGLKRSVTMIEAGCFADGLGMAARDPALKNESKSLRDDLMAAAATIVTTRSAALADPIMSVRLDSYLSLRSLSTQLKGSEPAKTADKAMLEATKDKAFKREIDAERAYRDMMANLGKVPADKRAVALAEALPRFAKAYDGTVYAQRATSLKH